MRQFLDLLIGQLGLGQHFSGLLTSNGVHVEVLEEDLGATGGRSASLGVVLGLDVDGRSHRSVRVVEGCSLVVGTGDTVALRVGCLDDELQVGHIGGDAVQGEGHRGGGEDDSRPGGCLDTGEGRHGGHNLATAVQDPVVEPHEEVPHDPEDLPNGQSGIGRLPLSVSLRATFIRLLICLAQSEIE